MPKIIQIAATSCTNRVGDQWPRLFALTDGGDVLRLSDSQGWVLVPEPEWEALGLADQKLKPACGTGALEELHY